MKILDNLKKIFDTRFSDLFNNVNIKLIDFSRNTKYVLEIKNKKLSLDLSKATPEEKKLIKEKIIDVAVQEENQTFLSDSSVKKAKQIKSNLPEKDDEELLKFYKDKLPPDMQNALEASLVVRRVFRSNGDISDLKKDIAQKYPEFGNNLCNMTTEGYFDNHFKDLYVSMLNDDKFDILDYQKKVKKIVVSLPYTVFVTKFKKFDAIAREVEDKIQRLKKYGTARLLLHGIGKANVLTTYKIIEEYKDDKNLHIDVEVNKQDSIITATFKF